MSKIESYSRYYLIIKKLRTESSFEEISNYLDYQSDLQNQNFRISKRTFQRDLNDIRALFNFDIRYRNNAYYIHHENDDHHNERMLEAFDTFNALNLTDRLSSFIHFEKRKPQGTDHLYGLLHAIQKQLQLQIKYHKFWEDSYTERTIEPYALKEFKNRWYVMGNDKKDNTIKSFALDRIKDITFLSQKFQKSPAFNIDDHFKYCFGIIGPNADSPEEVILSFEPFQGKYIKTLPLHHTQEILLDTKKEVRIKLTLYITHDFKMELLSLGDEVKVLQPQSLIEDLKSIYKKALKQY